MNLIYLPANNAWVFTFGEAITRMGSADMFLPDRDTAIYAARSCGLKVSKLNVVSPIHPTYHVPD